MIPSWVIPVLTVGTAIFSVGVTWGILSYRQKRSEKDTTDVVKELKDCVGKLQGVVTEVEVMKVANARLDRQGEDHEKRLVSCEIQLAKLQPRRKR